MDLVLGLSITSQAARVVVVEGAAGEGDTVRHDTVDIDAIRMCGDHGARGLAELLLGRSLVDAPRTGRLRSVGVSWTDAAAAEGSTVLQALAAAGFDNFIAVSECDAAAALAHALQGLAGSEDIAVCIVEPDSAIVATVHAGTTLAERIPRTDGGTGELVGDLASLLRPADWIPDAIFALGSAEDLDLVMGSLRDTVSLSIVSAAGADVAMARGAALAAAWAISAAEEVVAPSDDVLAAVDEPTGHDGHLAKVTSRVGALTSVLVAAVVTFVVSVSAVLGLRLTSETAPTATEGQVAAAPASPAKARPPVVRPPQAQAALAPPVQVPPPAPEAVAPQAPPLPDAAPSGQVALIDSPESAPAPVYGPMEPAPPAAAVDTPPAYVPPPNVAPVAPPPDYAAPAAPVPDTQPQPQPRLRDRIIEKIPIVGRFHEPKPQ